MGAPAARAVELSRHWAAAGHEVTVLTGFPNHPTGVVPPEYRAKLRRLVMRENVDGVKVVRTWLLPAANRGSYQRMMNYGSFCISSALTGLFIPRPDVVIATSPQLLVGLSGWWLARAKRVPFVFEVRDLWPESLIAVGMGRPDSILHRVLAKLAGFLYAKSDHIVVVTPAFKDHLIRHWCVPPEKISIVENGVETDLFRPGPPDEQLRRELGLEGKFVVSYIGTMGMAHGLETLIESAAGLQQSAPQVMFLLVGEGAEKDRIIALAKSRVLTNMHFVDQQVREKIPDYIRLSNACLVLLRKTELFKTVIPTKMLEFMSCGVAVILVVDGQARQVVEEAQAGLFVEPGVPKVLAEAVIQLANDAELRQSLGANGRQYIVQHFSRQQKAELYTAVLAGILESSAETPGSCYLT